MTDFTPADPDEAISAAAGVGMTDTPGTMVSRQGTRHRVGRETHNSTYSRFVAACGATATYSDEPAVEAIKDCRSCFPGDTLADLERARRIACELEAQNAALIDALRQVGRDGCTTFVGPSTCVDSGRSRNAEWAADRWCDGCIATVALAACDGIPE